eukprot:gene8993-16130_t
MTIPPSARLHIDYQGAISKRDDRGRVASATAGGSADSVSEVGQMAASLLSASSAMTNEEINVKLGELITRMDEMGTLLTTRMDEMDTKLTTRMDDLTLRMGKVELRVYVSLSCAYAYATFMDKLIPYKGRQHSTIVYNKVGYWAQVARFVRDVSTHRGLSLTMLDVPVDSNGGQQQPLVKIPTSPAAAAYVDLQSSRPPVFLPHTAEWSDDIEMDLPDMTYSGRNITDALLPVAAARRTLT